MPTIEISDLKDYVRRIIAKDTLRIAVVGDVDPDTLGKLLDKTFGSLPAKAELTPIPDVVATKPPQRAFVPLDVPQTVVTFGGPGINRHDPDFMPAYVVNHILGGGGLSSRLYKEVREKRGLAYSIYSFASHHDVAGLVGVGVGCLPAKVDETLDVVRSELRRLADDLVGALGVLAHHRDAVEPAGHEGLDGTGQNDHERHGVDGQNRQFGPGAHHDRGNDGGQVCRRDDRKVDAAGNHGRQHGKRQQAEFGELRTHGHEVGAAEEMR